MSTNSAQSVPFWADLRRITSSAQYFPEVDGIRFVAILAVFVFHLAGDVLRHSPMGYNAVLRSNPLFWITQILNIGVQLFFVLSGYVLAMPFVRHYRDRGPVVSLKRYFGRRVTRLEPPYVVSLLVLFVAKFAAGRGSAAALLPHLGASFGYIHNLVYGQPSDINFVAWSLEVEVQFYLLAPFLCFLFLRNGSALERRVTLVVVCIGWSVALALFGTSPRVGLSLLGQMPYFLAGLLLAETAGYEREIQNNARLIWDAVCIALVLFLFYCIYLGWAVIYAGALTVAACYWTAFRSRWVITFLRAGFVSTVGGMCYSIYLLHNYVIGFAGRYTEWIAAGQPFVLRLMVQGCLLGLLVLLISGLFYLLIERPCMRPDWPNRLAARVAGLPDQAISLLRYRRRSENRVATRSLKGAGCHVVYRSEEHDSEPEALALQVAVDNDCQLYPLDGHILPAQLMNELVSVELRPK